jgi:hypothetical protein
MLDDEGAHRAIMIILPPQASNKPIRKVISDGTPALQPVPIQQICTAPEPAIVAQVKMSHYQTRIALVFQPIRVLTCRRLVF